MKVQNWYKKFKANLSKNRKTVINRKLNVVFLWPAKIPMKHLRETRAAYRKLLPHYSQKVLKFLTKTTKIAKQTFKRTYLFLTLPWCLKIAPILIWLEKRLLKVLDKFNGAKVQMSPKVWASNQLYSSYRQIQPQMWGLLLFKNHRFCRKREIRTS